MWRTPVGVRGRFIRFPVAAGALTQRVPAAAPRMDAHASRCRDLVGYLKPSGAGRRRTAAAGALACRRRRRPAAVRIQLVAEDLTVEEFRWRGKTGLGLAALEIVSEEVFFFAMCLAPPNFFEKESYYLEVLNKTYLHNFLHGLIVNCEINLMTLINQ